MKRMSTILGAFALVIGVVGGVAACAPEADTTEDAPATPDAMLTTVPNGFNSKAARDYCATKGGTVTTLQPTYGTDLDADEQVPLGEAVLACRFDADDQPAEHADEAAQASAAGSVYVDLVTLYSKQPTLAALAYLSKTELPDSQQTRSTTDALCTALGGTSHFGPAPLPLRIDTDGTLTPDDVSHASDSSKDDASDDAAPVDSGLVDADDDAAVNPCVFADRSFIGKWAIAYYSSSTIRGIDLATVFRFDIKKTPQIYPEVTE